MTKKEEKKLKRLVLYNLSESLRNEILNIKNISDDERNSLLFSVEKIISLTKTQSEALRLAEVVCFCGKDDEKDKRFKNALYSQIQKIYKNIDL